MNERLYAYKKQKAKVAQVKKLNRKFPKGIPSDYWRTTAELKREYRRVMEAE